MGWRVFDSDYSYPDVYGYIRNTHTYRQIMYRLNMAKLNGKDSIYINSDGDEFYWWDAREVALCLNYDFGYKVKFGKNWRRGRMITIYLNEKDVK